MKYNMTLSESAAESVAMSHYAAKTAIAIQAASDVVQLHLKDSVIDNVRRQGRRAKYSTENSLGSDRSKSIVIFHSYGDIIRG